MSLRYQYNLIEAGIDINKEHRNKGNNNRIKNNKIKQ